MPSRHPKLLIVFVSCGNYLLIKVKIRGWYVLRGRMPIALIAIGRQDRAMMLTSHKLTLIMLNPIRQSSPVAKRF